MAKTYEAARTNPIQKYWVTQFLSKISFTEGEDEINDHCKGDKESINFEFGGLEFEMKAGKDVDLKRVGGAMEFLYTLFSNAACLLFDYCDEHY